jgi:hypothetical protein
MPEVYYWICCASSARQFPTVWRLPFEDATQLKVEVRYVDALEDCYLEMLREILLNSFRC